MFPLLGKIPPGVAVEGGGQFIQSEFFKDGFLEYLRRGQGALAVGRTKAPNLPTGQMLLREIKS